MRREPIAWHCVSLANTGKIEITQDAKVVELRRQETWNNGKAWKITPLYLNRTFQWLPVFLMLAGMYFAVCSYGTQSAVKEIIYLVLANIHFVGALTSWD